MGTIAACGEPDGESRKQDAGSASEDLPDADAEAEEDGGETPLPFRCPDPEDPLVHYQATDISECPIEELVCMDEQRGFHNACGCGCIDKGDPACSIPPEVALNLISPSPSRCVDVTPECALGQKPFNNLCGCGCVDE